MSAIKQTERTIQRDIIRHCAMRGIVAVHVPNGAHLSGGTLARAKQMAALKADGFSPGFPDLILFCGQVAGRIGFVEVKSRFGVVSDDQKKWAAFMAARGFNYALVRSVEDLDGALGAWGWIAITR